MTKRTRTIGYKPRPLPNRPSIPYVEPPAPEPTPPPPPISVWAMLGVDEGADGIALSAALRSALVAKVSECFDLLEAFARAWPNHPEVRGGVVEFAVRSVQRHVADVALDRTLASLRAFADDRRSDELAAAIARARALYHTHEDRTFVMCNAIPKQRVNDQRATSR